MAETKILANREAEQSVLGSVFFSESSIKLLMDKIKVDDFYYLRHQLIYQSMIDLFTSHSPIDSTTVISNLQDKGKLADCGGSEYILDLAEAVPSVSNLETYIVLVKDKAVQRKVIAACNDIIKESMEDISDSGEFLDSVEKKIYDATRERTAGDLVPVSKILDDAKVKIELNAMKEEGSVIGLNTGFDELNRLTLGFQNSELIILAARPSMGKTALALNIATNVAMLPSHPYVAFFSLEMGLEQLALRLLSSKSLINQKELKTGHFYERDAWSKINYAIGALKNANLMFDDSGVVKVQDLRSICRKKKSDGKLDFVVVDYLQLLSSSSRTESRVQEVSEISRTLKEMARELNIPVLALSQLSRSVEMRADKMPIMADLRESGSIEQDADVILFIYRDEYYNKETEKKNIAAITIAKNRNGVTDSFELLFKPELTTFENLAKE